MSAAPPAALTRHRGLLVPALRAALDRLSPEVRVVAGYHAGLLDIDGKPAEAGGGKALRPALTLLACAGVGGAPPDALPGAVAVQLVHDFSLLHDDVMDHDLERRHRPTAWAVFGVGRAVLAGDALLSLALTVLLEAGRPEAVRCATVLARATDELITGQGEDLAFEHRDDVSVDGCLAMCAGKTGALLGASAAIGGLLGGAGDECVAWLDAFGRHLGLAFQAVDDLLGIWGRPEVTGKPAFSDLRQGKRSLPVAAALQAGGPRAHELGALLARTELRDGAAAHAAGLVEANGGRVAAAREAERQLDLALTALERADLEPFASVELRDLAHFVVHREL